jgi:signal transduction histidine kinase
VAKTPEEQIAALTARCRELEAQLRHAQKMETLGVIASGIAHDFNNLLTGILGYAELLKAELGGEGELHEAAEMIESAASQAAQLSAQMLTLARGGESQRVRVDVHRVLRQVIDLLGSGNGKAVRLEARFCEEPLAVEAEPTQIFQVFLNLALNARDAVSRGGSVAIQTDLNGDGHWVRVSVIDNGVGIPEELRERIFEPFFTTKEGAQGTGIGLAVVRRIVEDHAGRVELESAPGQGSRFSVLLPASPEKSETARSSAA